MKANHIRVEYLKDPLGIDVLKPRITWTCRGGKKQTAYRIDYLLDGVKKSTGKIDSERMRHDLVDSFHSRSLVTFTITLFDEEGKEETSKEHRFEYGLLSKEDWKAKWIGGDYKVDKRRRYPVDCFRKVFQAKDVEKARIYLSACGLYEAKINGKRVGDFVLAPGSTDNRKRIQYQTYDVKDLLKDGENVLEILLGDGWYRGTNGAWGHPFTFGKETAVIAQLEMFSTDGKETDVLSDESFDWSNDGPIGINDLKDGERVDARKIPSYSHKAILKEKKANLTSSNNYFVKEMEFFKPIEKITTPSGKTVLKFPQNIAGYIAFHLQGKSGDFIRIRLGERLDENGEFTQSNIQCRSKRKVTPLQEIDYIFKDGINDYKSTFFFGGFRYALIETDVPFEKDDFTAIAVYSDFERTSDFECSNPLINTFYHNTLRSLLGNAIDVPTDCPTRERAGWTGDSQIFFNSACYLVDYAPFGRKHVRDLTDRQSRNGKFHQIVPTVHEDFYMAPMNGSAGWADAGVLIPYRFYRTYRDERILTDNFDNMLSYARFLMRRCGKWGGPYAKWIFLSGKNRKYLVNCGQSYGEWTEPNDIHAYKWTDFCSPHPEESTAYTFYTLSCFKEICRLLKREDIIKELEPYIEGTKKAYQELITKKGFELDSPRQAKQVRPLYMKLLREEDISKARKILVKNLENYHWRIGTGFLSTPFILDVLCDIDVEMAYRLLENEEMPGWLYMAKNDTTTVWESWEGESAQKGVSSLNHYSKGSLVEWLMKSMLGIRVVGENHFEIHPIPGGHVTYAKGYYDSLYGRVESSWKRENGKVLFDITIPENCSAIFSFRNKETKLEVGRNHLEFDEKEEKE